MLILQIGCDFPGGFVSSLEELALFVSLQFAREEWPVVVVLGFGQVHGGDTEMLTNGWKFLVTISNYPREYLHVLRYLSGFGEERARFTASKVLQVVLAAGESFENFAAEWTILVFLQLFQYGFVDSR